MKAGARALGVAASDGTDRSTLAGALVRADRVFSGLSFASCTVGGTDATDAVVDLFGTLGREDVQYLLLAGVAPAWFNVLDLPAIRNAVERPVLSVAFESSTGLESALKREFEGEALERRLRVYNRQPPRRRVDVNGEEVWVRAAGCGRQEAADVVRGFTPVEAGGRPEPVRVARLAARAGREYRDDGPNKEG